MAESAGAQIDRLTRRLLKRQKRLLGPGAWVTVATEQPVTATELRAAMQRLKKANRE